MCECTRTADCELVAPLERAEHMYGLHLQRRVPLVHAVWRARVVEPANRREDARRICRAIGALVINRKSIGHPSRVGGALAGRAEVARLAEREECLPLRCAHAFDDLGKGLQSALLGLTFTNCPACQRPLRNHAFAHIQISCRKHAHAPPGARRADDVRETALCIATWSSSTVGRHGWR